MADLARIAHFPGSLRERSRLVRLASAPALLVHPEGDPDAPAPYLVWLHGRTVHKEIDSARLQRLSRGGIGVAALDLPGHGERLDPAYQAPGALSMLMRDGVGELDAVVDALKADPRVRGDRLALGGMSAGGMISLRRLCDPHPFQCAVVEGTAGDFEATGERRFAEAASQDFDPARHLDGWRAIPFLAFHSEKDQVVPVAAISRFVDALQTRYAKLGSKAEVELVTFPETGAPEEHLGFGHLSGQVRSRTVDFLRAHLLP